MSKKTQDKPSWFFAPLNGGEESGLNEPGIETFKRSASLGRETCQNILDHPDGSGKPCVAVFEHLDLPAADFPGREEFMQVFESCRAHVLGMMPDGVGKEHQFFEQGLELLKKPTIPTLRIGDENTTGLDGGDDERSKPFWRLLKGQGFSSLQGVGGGTYGIGQRAPFAHSALRTVLYATKLPTGGEAFIAKAILSSHPSPFHPAKEMTQPKGWFCIPSPSPPTPWRTLREGDAIPTRYRRVVVGTDLYVTAYTKLDWEQRVRHAVLQNFFSAIDRGLLEVRIAKSGVTLTTITRDNLEQELIRAANEARESLPRADYRQGLGATLYYLRALRQPLTGGPYTRAIDKLGTVKLYVHRDPKDSEVPERWACMRKPMMVVEDHGSRLLSRFAAVLVCDDNAGSGFLAQMEDPRHEKWHEEEARNWKPEERKQGREARLAIGRFVSETLKLIRDESMPPSQDVPLLGRYLPLESETDDDSGVGTATSPTGGNIDEETGHKINKEAEGPVSGRARKARPGGVNIDIIAPTGGQAGEPAPEPGTEPGPGGPGGPSGPPIDPGQPGPPGPGPGTGSGTSGGGDGGGGTGTGESTGADGGGGGTGPGGGTGGGGNEGSPGIGGGPVRKLLTSAEVRFRSYVDGAHYCVILESSKDIVGDVELRAVGEDSTYPIAVLSATDATTGATYTVKGARIIGIKLENKKARRINVKVESDLSLCLSLAR